MTADKRILVVDDEDATRNHIRSVLQTRGYQVLTARDFDEAVATYRRQRGKIELLLTDVALPGRSGCDLAIALRQEDPGLRVLLISGYTGAEVLQFYGVRLTDVHFLQKPFRPDDLLARVASVLIRFGSASA